MKWKYHRTVLLTMPGPAVLPDQRWQISLCLQTELHLHRSATHTHTHNMLMHSQTCIIITSYIVLTASYRIYRIYSSSTPAVILSVAGPPGGLRWYCRWAFTVNKVFIDRFRLNKISELIKQTAGWCLILQYRTWFCVVVSWLWHHVRDDSSSSLFFNCPFFV